MAGEVQPAGLALKDPLLGLRPEREADVPFLQALYAATRADELARVDWPREQADRFIAQQFRAQRSHYREHYPGAAFLVVEFDGEPVGRLYLHETGAELRLMDIILGEALRGRGLGRELLRAVVERALGQGLAVTLHVEPFNPARAWYERIGLELVEVRGVYWFMRLAPEDAGAALERLSTRGADDGRSGRVAP